MRDKEEEPSGGFISADGEVEAEDHQIVTEGAGAESAALARQRLSMKFGAYAGPIPPPERFAQYEQACPGAGSRIIAMAEAEAANRHALQLEGQRAMFAAEKRGQIFGFTLIVLLLVGGAGLMLAGLPGVGVAAMIGAVASALGSALWNRYSEWKELKAERAEREKAEREREKAEREAAQAAQKQLEAETKKQGKKGGKKPAKSS